MTSIDPSWPFKAFHACLAPMTGVTDLPFRSLAVRLGASYVVSEMIASKAYLCGSEEMKLKSIKSGLPSHIPHVVQLAGCDAALMAEATRLAEQGGADIIDINMGCPAKKVTGSYSGSALMRDPDHALRLIEAVRTATKLPVTLKMRLGWDDRSLNAKDLAMRAEQAGIAMLTVHGRTRQQFYNGEANWHAVHEVKQSVSIPVIVNGDIVDEPSARKALEASGADAVMVGRGAYGRPWMPALIEARLKGSPYVEPDREMLSDIIAEHYQAMLVHYGIENGLRAARKHIGWYLDAWKARSGDTRCSALKQNIMTETSHRRVLSLLANHFRKEALAA